MVVVVTMTLVMVMMVFTDRGTRGGPFCTSKTRSDRVQVNAEGCTKDNGEVSDVEDNNRTKSQATICASRWVGRVVELVVRLGVELSFFERGREEKKRRQWGDGETSNGRAERGRESRLQRGQGKLTTEMARTFGELEG
ncbi:hypothetical protein BU24DRAFT_6141 [Aaosphaeria arxii CBS 175.79]|uniref:Secreted protein n=1 Tax=Aaosphaeria arxii CBS 175.79 TaxID=1450172 RepID=A0A6A5Y541_9PLEO|nr:uncharacterized protein BU24DRAFT_6141 [Aaosphaeria arxii CBS 175.79]KAF2020675.1 hypothetical protein BU24DRAFT_6141 [Aaosphaeria arxii CBS 175.79]